MSLFKVYEYAGRGSHLHLSAGGMESCRLRGCVRIQLYCFCCVPEPSKTYFPRPFMYTLLAAVAF